MEGQEEGLNGGQRRGGGVVGRESWGSGGGGGGGVESGSRERVKGEERDIVKGREGEGRRGG